MDHGPFIFDSGYLNMFYPMFSSMAHGHVSLPTEQSQPQVTQQKQRLQSW